MDLLMYFRFGLKRLAKETTGIATCILKEAVVVKSDSVADVEVKRKQTGAILPVHGQIVDVRYSMLRSNMCPI